MSNLTYLNDASVLHNLRQRYLNKLIYVSMASTEASQHASAFVDVEFELIETKTTKKKIRLTSTKFSILLTN